MTRRPAAASAARLRRLFAPPAGGPVARAGGGAGLGARAARGALATVVGQWLRLVLQTGSTILLARLLTPREYGLVGMVTALVGIGDIVWTLGLSTATIQRLTVTADEVNAFFWLQVLLGGVMTALTVALAPLVASFYNAPAVSLITVVFAFNFLLGGLSAQHLALLSRQMRFFLLSLIDVVGLAAGLLVALVIALRGGGYWALVAQVMTLSVVRIVISWYSSGWLPGIPRRTPNLWPAVRFGLNLGVTNALDYTALNADNVLLGRFYGASVLGIYARAYNLLLLPVRQIQAPVSRVAIPVLSYLQEAPDRFRRYFVSAMSAVAYASLPTLALLATLAPEVVRVLLGPKWTGVVPVFRILALAGAVTTFRGPTGWLFVATGHTGRQAVWALVNRPIIVLGFVAGLPWRATGVAWGLVVSTAVLVVPQFVIAVRDTPVRLVDVVAASRRPAALGAATFACGTAVHAWLGSARPLVTMAVTVAAVALMLAALVAVWGSFRSDLRELKTAFRYRNPVRPAPEEPTGAAGAEPAAVAVP